MSTIKKLIVVNLPTSDWEFVEKVQKASKSDLFDLVIGFPSVQEFTDDGSLQTLKSSTNRFTIAVKSGCTQVWRFCVYGAKGKDVHRKGEGSCKTAYPGKFWLKL
jgi:hypothetical protein